MGHRTLWSVELMCQVLEVSRSGYYAWEGRRPSKRAQDDAKYKGILFKAFHESKKTYGCGRLASVLEDMGFCVGRRRVSRLQREAKLFPVQRKKFYHTTDSDHSLPICPNLVKQDFSASRPNALWTSDVKMVRTNEGWLYLCVILDVFSRKIVGWAMESYKGAVLVLKALQLALSRRRLDSVCIFHSDRGSEYAAIQVQRTLVEKGFVQSMSGTGNCYDNAVTETFFATTEKEWLQQLPLETRKDTRTKIFCYIEGWYNRKRKHSYLGNISPEEFEKRHGGT
jgi:putative transposase